MFAFNYSYVGSVSENVYLYCASERLATVVRALIDGPHKSHEAAARSEDHIGTVCGIFQKVIVEECKK